MRIDHVGLHDLYARLARTLVQEYRIQDVIERLGSDIQSLLDVAGAGVMLEDESGHLRFFSTSDEKLRALEQLQVELDEGPCLYAYRSRERVIAPDLRDDQRFSRFGPLAVAAGMLAVYSFPMAFEDTVVGALNVYRHEAGRLTDEQEKFGEMFADVATAYLLNARAIDQAELLNQQLQIALNSRVVIEQAKGYVAALCGVTPGEAFEGLRHYARNRSRKLNEIARQVIEGELDVGELGLHPSGSTERNRHPGRHAR